MSFRDLSAPEMIAISAQFLNPAGNQLSILTDYILLEGLIVIIRETHDGLLMVVQQPSANEIRIQGLTAEMSELDARQSSMVRGIYNYLESMEDLADTPENKRRYGELKQTLFPK